MPVGLELRYAAVILEKGVARRDFLHAAATEAAGRPATAGRSL